jgi:hypothetical protein
MDESPEGFRRSGRGPHFFEEEQQHLHLRKVTWLRDVSTVFEASALRQAPTLIGSATGRIVVALWSQLLGKLLADQKR